MTLATSGWRAKINQPCSATVRAIVSGRPKSPSSFMNRNPFSSQISSLENLVLNFISIWALKNQRVLGRVEELVAIVVLREEKFEFEEKRVRISEENIVSLWKNFGRVLRGSKSK